MENSKRTSNTASAKNKTIAEVINIYTNSLCLPDIVADYFLSKNLRQPLYKQNNIFKKNDKRAKGNPFSA